MKGPNAQKLTGWGLGQYRIPETFETADLKKKSAVSRCDCDCDCDESPQIGQLSSKRPVEEKTDLRVKGLPQSKTVPLL